MKQYEMFELEFKGTAPEGSHAEVDLQAEFSVNGNTTSVKGFYAGNGTYKVRFYPAETGTYTYKISGVVNASGTEVCEAPAGHGIVKADGTHFTYADGTPYYPFGTTVYALAHQDDALVEETLASLEKAPFNKVRHCIFPKDYDYNHNDPEYYPFEKKEDGSWDVHHPCFAYWERFEKIIYRMGEMGIETDLILFHPYDRWGFRDMCMEDNLVYLDYLLRRLSAVPYIWWSIANEYDVVFSRKMEEWYDIEQFIVKNDPYSHLLSNHNCIVFYDFARPDITHCCVQTIAMHMTDRWMEQFKKPVVFDECCYEGDIQHEWGNISGKEMTNRFWKACAKGAYATHGETFYSDDEILWWARGGKLKGKSTERIAYLKDIIYSLPSALEPWQEPSSNEESDAALGIDPEQGKEIFQKIFSSNPPVDAANLEWKSAVYNGHAGEDVYLKYYAQQCVAITSINLPEEYTYKIEMIDTWNMTRETLVERASGKTKLKMPGKEGMAVIATRI